MTGARDHEQYLRHIRAVLEPLPTEGGGVALVLASPGPPPALSLLSSGDVHIDGQTVRAAVYRDSAVASRLGDAFTLLVPAGETSYRVEVRPAWARLEGNLHLIEGPIESIRPTSEPPWVLNLSFAVGGPGDLSGFLDYWRSVRSWLASGAGEHPPTPVA